MRPLILDFGEHFGNRRFFREPLFSYNIKSTDAPWKIRIMSTLIISCCRYLRRCQCEHYHSLQKEKTLLSWIVSIFKTNLADQKLRLSKYASLVETRFQLKDFILGMKFTYGYFTLCFLLKHFFLFYYICLWYCSCPHFLPFAHLHPAPTLPQAISHHCPCPWVIHMIFTNPFTFFSSNSTLPFPSNSCQSFPAICASVSVLLISLFCLKYSTHKWDHTTFVFHWLVYFTYHNSLQVHPHCCKSWVPSFWLLHSIPLYKCTTAFLSTHLLMGT